VADLLAPRDGAGRPWDPLLGAAPAADLAVIGPDPASDAGSGSDPDPDPEPDRAAAARRTSAADSRTEDPSTDDAASRRTAPQRAVGTADDGDWLAGLAEQVQYPTRMARRRASQAAQVSGRWDPDPKVTGPLLEHVEAELERLFQRPWDDLPGSTPGPPAAGPQVPEPPVTLRIDPETAEPPASEPPASVPAGQPPASEPPASEPPAGPIPEPALTPAPVSAPSRPAGTVRRPGDLFPDGGEGDRRRFGRLSGLVAALVVVLLVAGVGAVVLDRRDAGSDRPPAAPGGVPSQRLLAVSLADGGQIIGLSLLAAGPGGAQQVLVPSRLLLDVPGAGRIPVAQSLAIGPSAPGAAVADALGVRVAGSWVLDVGALAGLVDRLGGVTVKVDVDVPVSAKVGAAILVPAGDRRRLTGKQAVAYAALIVGEEPEAARLARQERVLTAVLAGLPAADGPRRALLAGLPGAPQGPALGTVVTITGALRGVAAGGSLPSTVLPVSEIDSGGAVAAYGLDTDGAARLTRSRLSGAAIAEPPGGRVRVLVQNGVGAPGLGQAARAQLVAAGLRYVGGGNVAGFGVRQTVVLLPDASSAQRARGAAVARALGLGQGSLRITDSAPTVADVVVVLGQDYRPS
jgi:hypothetical protein